MIKVLLTKSMGMVIADVEENLSDASYKLTNVCMIQQNQQGVTIVPFLSAVEERSIDIEKSELVSTTLLTARTEIYNQYNSMFGTGIQLTT